MFFVHSLFENRLKGRFKNRPRPRARFLTEKLQNQVHRNPTILGVLTRTPEELIKPPEELVKPRVL